MDIVDRAQKDVDEIVRLTAHNHHYQKEAEETGKCLFCGEPTPKGHRWCDVDCRDLWEKDRETERYRRLLNGK